MKIKAVRLHGAGDLRLEEFELPEIGESEILMKVMSDSLCTSTYKAVIQGANHKRVPPDVSEHPVIIGHEMCGEIVSIGRKVKRGWTPGQKVVIQPALKLESGYDPGYSYPYIGGAATYVIVPEIVLERGCLLPFDGDCFFKGSLVEAIGCILRGYKGLYHTDYSNYVRTDGAKKGGRLAILGGAGPMGIACTEMASGYAGVSHVVVTDINRERLDFAKKKSSPENAAKKGCRLEYVNTSDMEDPVKELIDMSDGGFDDVFVMVPVPDLFSMAEKICRADGCVNFFAGPADHSLMGSLNLYRIHYDGIHVVGTAGSIPEDTVDTIDCITKGIVNPGALVSHICGLKGVIQGIMEMEKPNGAKKVCYPHIDIPMVAIGDLHELGRKEPLYAALSEIVARHDGLWCAEAEEYLLSHAPKVEE